MALHIFERNIATKKYAVQRFKIGQALFVEGRRATTTESKTFWLGGYQYVGDFLLEDKINYSASTISSNLALEKLPTWKQIEEHDLNTKCYSFIRNYDNEVYLEGAIYRPYEVGITKVGSFAFEEYGDLSKYYCSPERTPKLTLEEAFKIYQDCEEDIKKLVLSRSRDKRYYRQGVGYLR